MSTELHSPAATRARVRRSRVLALACVAALAPWAATPALAASGSGSGYGTFAVAAGAGTVRIPVAGFPDAAFRTSSSTVLVGSGLAAYLNADTPVGARYGSSRGKPYVNLRTTLGGSPSVTTLDFERPTPAGTWAFTLGDVDADRVRVEARGADGTPLSATQLGWQGAFNYCQGSPRPSTCAGPGPFTDLPVWHPDSGTLVGNGIDTSGASGWFQPLVPVSSVTLTFSVQTGIPIYQLWTSALSADISGRVGSNCGTPSGIPLTLRRPDGSTVDNADGTALTAVTDASGGYRFADVAPGDYRVSLDAPEGYRPSRAVAAADTTGARDAADVDLQLGCTTIEVPDNPPIDTPDGGPVTIVTPPGPGPSRNSHPVVVDSPRHGTVRRGGLNTLVYTPRPGFAGTDVFSYAYTNSRGQKVVTTVRIRVRHALADTGADAALPVLGLVGGGLVVAGALLAGAVARGRRRRV
jgi:SdrD B-like domain/Bacterial Ig domain